MSEGQDGTDQLPPPTVPTVGDETTPAGDLGITVSLDQFSGPMDLLLYLVRRAEVDITELPVTTIADQFALWVSAAAGTTLDLEAAGDFVVLAATLLEIKARMVAPPPEGTEVADDGEDAFDPRAGLIRKLLVYRAAKEAAFALDARDDAQRLRHHRGHREVVPDDAAEVDAWELKDVGAGTIANLWFDLLKRIDGLGPRTVLVDDVPMGVRMAQVVEDMRTRGEGRLSELFAIDSGPIARVGIVMAVLECTRQRMLRVHQAEQYGDVHIAFRPEDDRAVASGDPGPPEMLPKRQRRPPLVTWSGVVAPETDEALGEEEPTVENEEQRFLRDLESSVGVERLLSRAADLELGFIAWWEETHPGEPLPHGVVKPEPPPPPPPPPPAPEPMAIPVARAEPKPKRVPKPPRVEAAEPAVSATPSAAAEIAAPVIPLPEPGSSGGIPDPQATVAQWPEQPAAVGEAVTLPQETPVASTPQATQPAVVEMTIPVIATAPSFDVIPLAAVDHQVAAPAAEPLVADVAQISDAPPATAALSSETEPATPQPVPEPLVEQQPSVNTPPEDTTLVKSVVASAAPTEVTAAPVAEVIAEHTSPSVFAEPQSAVESIAMDPAPDGEPEPLPIPAAALPDVAVEAQVVAAEVCAEAQASVPEVIEQVEKASATEVVSDPIPDPVDVAVAAPAPVVAEAAALVVEVAQPASVPPESVVQVTSAEPVAQIEAPKPTAPIVAADDPPPPPSPPPPLASPPPQTANTPLTTAPNTPTAKPTPMFLPRHRKLAALVALWVVTTVACVAWFQRPAAILTLSGPDGAIVARDSEVVWTLNLALDAEELAEASLPIVDPPTAGAVAWRDTRTCVFTPAGVLPPASAVTIRFDDQLRALGGFRFDPKALPSRTVATLPAVTVGDATTVLPAFGDGRIELALNRVPADSAALLAAVAISPAVPLRKAIVDGRLRLDGPFVPGQSYRLTVADTVPGKADDRPLAWQADVLVPARVPGARLAAGVGRGAAVEAVNLPWLVVENANGQREVLRFTASTGDVPARAELPAWLLAAGVNTLHLRWPGGESDVTIIRHDLPLTPADGAPAMLGGTLPVVSVR